MPMPSGSCAPSGCDVKLGMYFVALMDVGIAWQLSSRGFDWGIDLGGGGTRNRSGGLEPRGVFPAQETGIEGGGKCDTSGAWSLLPQFKTLSV